MKRGDEATPSAASRYGSYSRFLLTCTLLTSPSHSKATTASGNTFLFFLALMALGTFLCLALKDPALVRRSDGSTVQIKPFPGVVDEMKHMASETHKCETNTHAPFPNLGLIPNTFCTVQHFGFPVRCAWLVKICTAHRSTNQNVRREREGNRWGNVAREHRHQ